MTNSGSGSGSGSSVYAWHRLIRLMTVATVFSVFLIVFAVLTEFRFLFIFHIILIPVLSFATIIVVFSRSYVLAFLLMVTYLAVLVIDTLYAYRITPDVLVCRSHHCDDGRKWMITFLLLFIVGFMSMTVLLITNLWYIITYYAELETRNSLSLPRGASTQL